MAGYSGRPLADKLGVKPGDRVAVIGAPPGWTGIDGSRRLGKDLDLVLAFFTTRASLEDRWPALTGSLRTGGALWVAWPKKTARHLVPTDMTEQTARDVLLPTGWVDTKVCAVDEVWSGLKFVLRRQLRN